MTEARGGQWSDLGPRLISGGIAAAIGLWAMWVGGTVFHAAIALISGIMIWELVRMIGAERLAIPLAAVAAVAVFAAMELPRGFALPLLLAPAMIGFSQIEQHRLTYALYTAAILIAGFGIVALRDDFGFGWMAWLALVVISSDILGYFAGRFIGGPKFWPRVSPKKTWSGTVAGWVGAALIGGIFVWQGQSGPELIGISIAIAMAGQFGDIAESALKRRMGVKDSSGIIPGHGGMFDRFDAMLGASIFLLLVEQVIDFPPAPVPL
ncbi:MAG: phosphatidate cytidylyltransferase [Paracoccaceae bacterium]|nr:phosphatidate cytidylyltransferase [Paracoccaceae bacterium]